MAIALLIVLPVTAGCFSDDGNGSPVLGAGLPPATRDACTAVLVAGSTSAAGVRPHVPGNLTLSDTTGWLGLDPAPGQVTIAVIGWTCHRVVLDNRTFANATAVEVLVGVEHPRGLPSAHGGPGLYAYATITEHDELRRALRELGAHVFDDDGAVGAASSADGPGWAGRASLDGRLGRVIADAAGRGGSATNEPVRIYYTDGPEPVYVQGNLTSTPGNGTRASGVVQLTGSSILARLTEDRSLDGRGLVLGRGSFADAYLFADGE